MQRTPSCELDSPLIYSKAGRTIVNRIEWPDPTPEMLGGDPQFEAVWNAIKSWDIHVPGAYTGYCGATGNHVRAILDALRKE